MTIQQYNQAVDLYADVLYRFVLKHIKDTDIAKDIIQDTFEKVWRKVNEINQDKIKSYLFTSAYHTLIDYTRKQKIQGTMTLEAESQLQDQKQYSDLKHILDEALNKLPEIQKTVILLRDYEGYDYKEIGEITNLNESQVKVYIFRARTFLKNYIGKLEIVI